jgi:hypothetical protein
MILTERVIEPFRRPTAHHPFRRRCYELALGDAVFAIFAVRRGTDPPDTLEL